MTRARRKTRNAAPDWRIVAAALAVSYAGGCADERSGEGAASPGTGAASGWTIDPGGDINAFLDCIEAAELALVSAHRGGPAPGLPENSIEAMAATLAAVPALLEVDVAASADGVLYLMHDRNLDRTTTGEGPVDAATWREIAGLRLEDSDGRATDFAPPRFADALAWAKSRTILKVDIKRSARYEDIIDEIRRQQAEDRVVLIAYTMASAEKLHRLAPEMMISLSIDSQSALNRAVAAGVPADRLLGFTGTDAPRPRLNGVLEARDVEVIFGTLGGRDSIDAEIAETGDEQRYAEVAASGVDIIATDRPREAHAALLAAGRAPAGGQCGVSSGGAS